LSRAVDRVPGEQSGSGLLFQSGVQFGSLSREAEALLQTYMDTQGR
jgi:hypothetical protein